MSARKLLVKKLDGIFSLTVRMLTKKRYGRMCVFCGKKPIECCFHFQTRALYATRWVLKNAIGACHGCNMRNEYEPGPFIMWYINRLGITAYDELVMDSHRTVKFTDDDLNDMCRAFRKMLEAR